jgi:hypothetical protein
MSLAVMLWPDMYLKGKSAYIPSVNGECRWSGLICCRSGVTLGPRGAGIGGQP